VKGMPLKKAATMSYACRAHRERFDQRKEETRQRKEAERERRRLAKRGGRAA
jgi:hypothetical protein